MLSGILVKLAATLALNSSSGFTLTALHSPYPLFVLAHTNVIPDLTPVTSPSLVTVAILGSTLVNVIESSYNSYSIWYVPPLSTSISSQELRFFKLYPLVITVKLSFLNLNFLLPILISKSILYTLP